MRHRWKRFVYHVHHLATALGGSVGYQPNIQAGNGATFWVDVPYLPAGQQAGGAEGHESASPLLPGRDSGSGGAPSGAVLIAEDNVFILDLTEALLRRNGVEHVVRAVNGKDALAALTARDAPDFELVLMDVQACTS